MSGQFSAVILDTGDLIKITKVGNDAQGSNSLGDDLFTEKFQSGDVIKPPYNPDGLVELLEANTYHLRCCRQKAIDIAGLGYNINPEETDADKKAALEPRRKELLSFFTKNSNKKETFTESLVKAWTDYESVGWLVVEITRNKAGLPSGVYHIPAHTTRYKADGTGIIQRRKTKTGFKERHFKWFGDTDKKIDTNTKKPMTEVMYMINYSPKSDYYGSPDHMPAVGAMVGNNLARDYNINFFGNNAVPQYAVILEGGELTDDVENKIKEHFRNNIKGNLNAHRTLVLTAPDGGKIEFKPLAVEVKEGHFRLYRKDNRDEVVHAHGVPPHRIGIIEAGTLAGNIASESTKMYKDSIVEPRQQRLEARINQILSIGFGDSEFLFKFNEIDTDDEKLKADIEQTKANTAKVWLDAGVITPNEARKDYLSKESFTPDKNWGDEVLPIVRLASNPAWLKANAGNLAAGQTASDIAAQTKTPTSPTDFVGGGGVAKKQIAKAAENFSQWLSMRQSSQSD